MFFDMLTADAASKHGHEFSERQPNRWPAPPRRSPLRVLPYGGRPRLPARPRSLRGGSIMDELKEEPEEVESIEKSANHIRSVEDLHIPGAFRNYSPPQPSSPQSIKAESTSSPETLVVENYLQDEEADDGSLESSSLDKRTRRSKQQYSLAHPPPSSLPLRKQGIIRPRVLFQLQSLSKKFHKPVYEVSPLSRFDCSKKIGKRFSRLGKGKVRIATDDLAVLRVGDYNLTDFSSNEASELSDSRDVIGIISPLPFQVGEPIGQVHIILDDAVWQGTPSRDGKYDLQCLGSDVVSARWYVPKAKRKQTETSAPQLLNRKFYFAAMLPQTKKHPTLASLTRTNLDVYDSYTLYPGSSTEEPLLLPTPNDFQQTSTPVEDNEDMVDESAALGNSALVDESHRKLIIASSFWVMLCERWSSHYAFPSAMDVCGASSTPPVNRSLSLSVPNDSKSRVVDSSISTPVTSPSPAPEHQSTSARSSMRSVSLDASTTGSRRVIFPSFSFGRSNTPDRLPKGDDNDAIHTNSTITSVQDKSHDDVLEDNTDLKNSEDQMTDPIPDPTAQFRHILSLESPGHETPSPQLNARPDLFTRRKTISLSSALNGLPRRRSRSISWNWNTAIPSRSKNKTPDEPSRRYSAIMTHNNTPLHDLQDNIDASFRQSASPSILEDAILATKSIASSPLTTSSQEKVFDKEGSIQPAIDFVREGSRSPMSETVKSIVMPEEVPSITRPMPAGQSDTSPAVLYHVEPNDSDRRLSSDSSDVDIPDIDTPYWKEFDRLQTNNFWQRAHQLQNIGTSEINSSVAPHLKDKPDEVLKLENISPKEDKDTHSEVVDATALPRKGWLTGLKYMGRRNHSQEHEGVKQLK